MDPRHHCLLLIVIGLSACASAPEAIRQAPPGAVAYAQVKTAPAIPAGARVRWGGTIVSVENEREITWIEVLERPLRGSGKPNLGRESQGRFLVRVEGFLDPLTYEVNREFTVVGTLTGSRERILGSQSMALPVVSTDAYYLWPVTAYTSGPYLYGTGLFFHEHRFRHPSEPFRDLDRLQNPQRK